MLVPLQFSFGVGSYDKGVASFYEYLNDLSSPHFHIAEFTTIIHNMWVGREIDYLEKHVSLLPKVKKWPWLMLLMMILIST